MLDIKNVDIGFQALKILKNMTVKEKDELKFKLDCRNIIIAAVKKICERSPMKYSVVLHLSSLAPRNILQNNQLYISRFKNLLQDLYEANIIIDSVAQNAQKQYVSAMQRFPNYFQKRFYKFYRKRAG